MGNHICPVTYVLFHLRPTIGSIKINFWSKKWNTITLRSKPKVVNIGLEILHIFYIFRKNFTYFALKKYIKYYIFDPKKLHILPRPIYNKWLKIPKSAKL